MGERICVTYSRGIALAATTFFGLLTVIGVKLTISASSAGSVITGVFFIAVVAYVFVLNAKRALRRGPSLILDDECLINVGSGKSVRWDKIGDLHLIQERWVLGEDHTLMFTDRATQDCVKLSLDQLSVKWEDLVKFIEERVGRQIPVTHRTAIRIRGRAA